MNVFKKIAVVLFPVFYFLQGGAAYAAGNSCDAGQGGGSSTNFIGITNPINACSIQDLIVDILGIVVRLGAIVAVFFIIYSGFLFVTARGNEDQISTARKSFMWTVIGAAVLLGAQVIALLIQGTISQIGGPHF